MKWFGSVWLMVAAAVLVRAPAHAHFILVSPDSWMSQDALGLPEKLGPCGNEGGGTPTGKVTAFHPGDTVTVTIDEVIPHPGHYRVALSVSDRSQLPPEPAVTPAQYDPCGSAAIEDPPQFPILADNLLPHTQAFSMPQTFTVTLPTDVTCTKCTLQVLEFMSSHGQPCFYHHCADISIQGDAAMPTPTPLAPTATVIPTVTVTATPTPPCVGDCGSDGAVSIDEIVLMVNIAMGMEPVDMCLAGDADGDGTITVDEVVAAVRHAMQGCPGTATVGGSSA